MPEATMALARRARPGAVPRGTNVATIIVFVATVAGLIALRQSLDRAWTPSGSDWDQWYTSALYWRRDIHYPEARWPLYGLVAALLQALTGTPLHVAGALVSIGATALATALVFRLGARLVGPLPALVAAAFVVGQPPVVVHGNYIGPYALWAAVAALAVLGVTEGVATGRRAWWVVAGVGYGATLAVLEKGLLIGLALAPVVLLGLLVRRADARRNALCFVAPVAALALLYRLLPIDLVSLDFMMLLPRTGAPTPGGGPPVARGGYVFGRAMGPVTLFQTLRLGMTMVADDGAVGRALVKIQEFYPRGDLVSVCIAGLGWLVATVHAAVRAWRTRDAAALFGWLGVGAVVAAVLPSLHAEFNLRFLLPALVLAPLGVVGVFALDRRLGPLALLALPLAFLPGSPWRHSPWCWSDATIDWAWPADRLQAQIWFDVRRMAGTAPVDLVMPMRGGLLLMESNPGAVVGRVSDAAERTAPDHHVLLPVDGVADLSVYVGGPASALPGIADDPRLGARPVLFTWRAAADNHSGGGDDRGAFVLLGPVP